MTVPRITLFARPGCHLCDDAREVISRVADDLGVAWEERDITQSAADLREYWEKIPVTFVDGVQHDFWRVSEDRLRQALSSSGADKSREVTPLSSLSSDGMTLAPGRGWCGLCAFVHKRRMVGASRIEHAPP
jgi:hypothetical protein